MRVVRRMAWFITVTDPSSKAAGAQTMNAGLAAPALAAATIATVVMSAVANQKVAKKMCSMRQCSRPMIRVPLPERWRCPRRLGYDAYRPPLEYLALIRLSLTLR